MKRLLKNLVSGVPRLRCLSLLILALAAGCQADGPELVTTSSGDLYLLRDGVLFHIQGNRATRVQGEPPFDLPPSEILKEFTDTIYVDSARVRTDLKLKYFGPSEVRYRLMLTPVDHDRVDLLCLSRASPFLQILLEDLDEFRLGTVRLSAFRDMERGFLRPLTNPVEVLSPFRLMTDSTVVAARGQLVLSADEFEKIAHASAQGPPDCS